MARRTVGNGEVFQAMDLPALATFACVALHCSYHGWYHVMLQKSCGGTSEEDPLFFCGQGQKVSMPSRDDPRCGLKRVPGQKSRSSVLLVGGIQKANISGRYCRRLCHPDMTLSPRLRRGKLRRRVLIVFPNVASLMSTNPSSLRPHVLHRPREIH